MAGQASFDITSTVDLQEVDNAVNQAKKELGQRYDFKGSKAAIEFKRGENLIELIADDNFKMEAVREMLMSRMVRRDVPVKNLKLSDPEPIAGGLVKRKVELQQGIPTDTGKAIVKFLKDQKDRLQAAIQQLKAQDFGIELQFGNYRE